LNPESFILETSALKKHFRVKGSGFLKRISDAVYAVDGVDLQVLTGEVLGIVGESGCGKTTFARLVLNLIRPTSGRIIFEGSDVTRAQGPDLKALRRNMQLIFQDPYDSLNPRMKVGSILEEPLRIHRVGDKKDRQNRILELIETVGLDRGLLSNFPAALSGGQRQRVGIARALAVTPKLVVCDEPVSALDVSIRAQILNLLVDLQKQFSLTYLFISHDLSIVQHLADRVAVMYLGRIVEIAKKDSVFHQPHHPYTESLLSAVPTGDPRREWNRRKIILEGDPPSPIQRPTGCHFHPRCPIAQQICTFEDPPLRAASPDHLVACHFAAPYPILNNSKNSKGILKGGKLSLLVNKQIPTASFKNE
jgi:oligopeptide transport system ATP-binding protein